MTSFLASLSLIVILTIFTGTYPDPDPEPHEAASYLQADDLVFGVWNDPGPRFDVAFFPYEDDGGGGNVVPGFSGHCAPPFSKCYAVLCRTILLLKRRYERPSGFNLQFQIMHDHESTEMLAACIDWSKRR